MTTEEKVRRILENYRDNSHSISERGTIQDQRFILKQATQAILELIKPMSREKLINLIANYKCGYSFVYKSAGNNYIGNNNAACVADAILAEWRKE